MGTAFVGGTESSRERNCSTAGTFAPRSEWSWERKVQFPSHMTYVGPWYVENTQWRTVVQWRPCEIRLDCCRWVLANSVTVKVVLNSFSMFRASSNIEFYSFNTWTNIFFVHSIYYMLCTCIIKNCFLPPLSVPLTKEIFLILYLKW